MGPRLDKQRDKEKPLKRFLHHSVPDRMSDTTTWHFSRISSLNPETSDDYGSYCRSRHEMGIYKDMDLTYDLKMLHPTLETRLGKAYEYGEYARLDSAQKAAWDTHYQPIIDQFIEADLQGRELAEWKYQRYMRDYAKTVQSLDENVGRLLDYLEENGMLENTVIFYTSDQGFYMGEHGWFDKRFMYEESFSTPLVMHLPKRFKKRVRLTSWCRTSISPPLCWM